MSARLRCLALVEAGTKNLTAPSVDDQGYADFQEMAEALSDAYEEKLVYMVKIERSCERNTYWHAKRVLIAGGLTPRGRQFMNEAKELSSGERPDNLDKPTGIPTTPTIVLVTVNDNETHAVLDAFVGEGCTPPQTTKGGVTYNALGTHGGCRLVHTICEMGAGGVGASQQRTREAIDHWQPKAIIAVGIAFGLDETKQRIGDVLVSTQIQDYHLGRLNSDGTLTPRGDKPSSSDSLRNRLRQTDTMETRRNNGWPKVRFGLVLSGQKLVDNRDYRESLKALFTEAIGGEMEGTGLYVSANAAKVDWIVIKAICDWGHDKNQADKDAWQKLAAKNAARVLKAALVGGGLYSLESSHTTMSRSTGTPAPNSDQAALSLWQMKLEYLQKEEALAVDAEMKFSIQQRIEEAKAKIQAFEGL